MRELRLPDHAFSLRGFAKKNQIGMAVVISVLLYVLNVIINPNSFNPNAFGSIFALTAMLAMASSGQTLVVISGGIDMSIGAIMSMTALITTNFMRGQPGYFFPSLFVGIAVGAAVGCLNGFGVARIGLPSMIVTLCVANVVTRLQYVFTNGKPTGTASAFFTASMQYRVFGIFPTSWLYLIGFIVFVLWLLNRTAFGQQLFLTGNNERAAFLSGIKTVRVKILTYIISGVLSGIAGVLGAGYMNFVMCQAFDIYTLNSIVAVVVGGTSLAGGKGSYIGTIAGSLLMIVLSNFLAVLDLPPSLRDLITGIVLIGLLAAYNREKAIRQ